MNKKEYTPPEIVIEHFNTHTVIHTSGGIGEGGEVVDEF